MGTQGEGRSARADPGAEGACADLGAEGACADPGMPGGLSFLRAHGFLMSGKIRENELEAQRQAKINCKRPPRQTNSNLGLSPSVFSPHRSRSVPKEMKLIPDHSRVCSIALDRSTK